MKRILGLAAALLLVSSLFSTVLMAADPLWTKTVDDATLTVSQTYTGGGIWKWTYTLTYGFTDTLDSFNAQLATNDRGAVPGDRTWGYAVDSDSGSPTPTYDPIQRVTWGANLTKVVWHWAPPSTSPTVFGTKVFSLQSVYGDATVGTYNLYLDDNGNPSYVHGFAGMAMPIPEPGSLALLGLAAIGVVGARRQRR